VAYLFKSAPPGLLKTGGWWYRPPKGEQYVHPITNIPHEPGARGGTLAEVVLRRAKEKGGEIALDPSRRGAVVAVIPGFEQAFSSSNDQELQKRARDLHRLLVEEEHFAEVVRGNLHVWGNWDSSQLGEFPENHPLLVRNRPVTVEVNPLRTGLRRPSGSRLKVNRPFKPDTMRQILALARSLYRGEEELPLLPFEKEEAKR